MKRLKADISPTAHYHDASNGEDSFPRIVQEVAPLSVVQNNTPRHEQLFPQVQRGLTIYCLGEITIVDPYGNEIVSSSWGKRNLAYSQQKKMIIEFVSAKIRREAVGRTRLLSVIFPEVWNEVASEKALAKLNETLTIRLSQLQQTFLPYEIFEKVKDGYQLHPTVCVSLFEEKKNVRKIKELEAKEQAPITTTNYSAPDRKFGKTSK